MKINRWILDKIRESRSRKRDDYLKTCNSRVVQICFLILFGVNQISYAEDTAGKRTIFNVGFGEGTRYMAFDFKFNGINQKYTTGEAAGFSIYFQKYLHSNFGIGVSYYPEWSGSEKIFGKNDSGQIELGKYASEGGNGILKVGIFGEYSKLLQGGLDIGYAFLGLHATDIIANDFKGGAMSIIPFIKMTLPRNTYHGCSVFMYYGTTISGIISGKMVGGSINYEFRFKK